MPEYSFECPTISIPEDIVAILIALEKLVPGVEFRLVGGCIRDLILNRPVNDWDVVCDADPSQLSDAGLARIDASFPVFYYTHPMIGKIEVACCRTERKVGAGHMGFVATPCKSFEEDAIRRDLTINACSWHYSRPTTIICYVENTEQDFIPTKVNLKPCSKAFIEDPVRAIRVARFYASIPGSKIDQKMFAMMYDLRNQMSEIPADRIRTELEKTFITAYDFNRFFVVLYDKHYENIGLPLLMLQGAYYYNILSNQENNRKPYRDYPQYLKYAPYILLSYACFTTNTVIKTICSRLKLSINSELDTVMKLAYLHEESLSIEIVDLYRSVRRGKLSVDFYIVLCRHIHRYSEVGEWLACCIQAMHLMKVVEPYTKDSITRAYQLEVENLRSMFYLEKV